MLRECYRVRKAGRPGGIGLGDRKCCKRYGLWRAQEQGMKVVAA
jgi:hypothetical protein